MLSRDVVEYLHGGVAKSIKQYLPLEQRILLLDILYFLSIKTEKAQYCQDSDVVALKKLYSFCEELGITPECYVSCAYDYMSKYVGKGHKVSLGYLFNESLVSYCAKNVHGTTTDGLLFNRVRAEVVITEKQIRQYSTDNKVDYLAALSVFFKTGRVSDVFLLYKVYMNIEPFASMTLSKDMVTLLNILRPMFVQMTAKYGLYPSNKILEWNNSKIESFKDCQIYFRDVYLNDLLPPSALGNEATDIGSKVHKVFEDVIGKYIKAKDKNIKKVYARHKTSINFNSVKKSIEEHLTGIEMFFTSEDSPFIKHVKPDTEIYIEEKMYLTLPDKSITFCGTADLILVNGDEAILIDYKTSKIADQKWIDKNNEKYHKQLSLYAKFIEEKFKVSKVTAIVVYTRGLIHTFEAINDNILEERAVDVRMIQNAMKMNNFRPNTSHCFLCRHPSCQFRSRESIWNADGTRKVTPAKAN